MTSLDIEPLSPRKKTSASFDIREDATSVNSVLGSHTTPVKRASTSLDIPMPLTTSKLANQLPPTLFRESSTTKPNMDEPSPMEELLAKLSEQQNVLSRQKAELGEQDSSSGLSSDTRPDTPPTERESASEDRPDAAEVLQLRKELELAQERMAQMDLELTQSRITKHTMEQAIGSPFEAPRRAPSAGPFGIPATGTFPSMMQPSFHGPGVIGGNRMPQQLRINTGVNGPSFMGMEQTPYTSDPSPAFSRPSSAFGGHSGFHTGVTPPITPLSFVQHGMQPHSFQQYMPQPIGTRLSPTATEFSVDTMAPMYRGGGNQYHVPHMQESQQTYMSTTEPMNYRRLLDRNMSCNWKYIVDKIVCNNDQQASIFLQQKLKVGTTEQKFEIVQAIIDQAYPLMVNRFGNFLIQRCFEHGSPEQVIAIARAIRGNTLNLSMDAFGCHVVQKAFDAVPEEYKAIMVHELLRRIPETVIHRYACHVWQKLFELRWSDSPPQIMKYVNEALRGMWHEVALGETGSLVVQNIFENCLEEDKRPCVNEVLASIDVIAHGQFGNWCIQHICEHGSIPDRTRAVDHVLRYANEYSMDQFASKVVEKCLKIGGPDFLDRYLDRICESRPDRPRMPLIDIAGDQFGNYLIQYILTNADPQRREVVAAHIRKHMVSLRGSKYGSRVAMLCCNPAFATRPGPPAGLPLTRGNSGYSERGYGSDLSRPYPGDRQYSGMPGALTTNLPRPYGGYR